MADPPADAQPLRTPPQRLPLQQTTERIAVALRVGNVVVGVPTALLAAVPPVSVRWVVGGLVVLAAWTVVFSLLAMTRGLVAPLMLVDAAVAVGFCLFIGRFVPVGRIDEGSSWIAVIGSICIVSLPFAFSARVAIPVGTLVVVAYAAGFPLAGQPGRGLVHSVVLLTQLVISVGVMAILRRASMAAETALAGETSARGAAAVAAARRADESAQLRLLHDTALTTLTLVGTGAVGRSRALTERAGADLAAIERIPESDRTGPHARVRLDEVLGELMRHPPAGLRLVHTLAPCTAPGHVADALAGAVGEALQNVARHADVDTATMRLTEVDGHVVVEVHDEGDGFDPAGAPAHRYGIRQSIIGRVAAVGGEARLDTAPGKGTQWTFEWWGTGLDDSTHRHPGRPVYRNTAIGAITVAGSWHLVNDLTGLVTGWADYRSPVVSAVAWGVVSALNVMGVVNMLSDRAGARLDLPVVGVPVLLACTAAVFANSRTDAVGTGGDIFATTNWAWATFGWQALLLLWRWPLRWLLCALGVNMALCLATAYATGPLDRVSLSRMVLVFWGTASIQVAVAGGARALVRLAERAARAGAERAELLAARQAAERVHADRQRRYRGIGQAVRQLLAGLATAELDPAEARVQQRCAVEASRLRRLIAEHYDAPSPLLHELRACADVAERRGVAVTLETAGILPRIPVQVRRALTEAPIHVLATARTQVRVTVVSIADPPEVEVNVAADAEADGASTRPTGGGADGAHGVEVTWSSEGEGKDRWVRTHWRDR